MSGHHSKIFPKQSTPFWRGSLATLTSLPFPMHGCRKGFISGGRGLHNNGLELKQTILSLFTEINSLAISSLFVKSL